MTDGLLVLRYLFGFTDDALVEDVLAPGAMRTSPDDIVAFLDAYQRSGRFPLGPDLPGSDPAPLAAHLSVPAGKTAAVPEPSAIVVFSIGTALLILSGWRRSRRRK